MNSRILIRISLFIASVLLNKVLVSQCTLPPTHTDPSPQYVHPQNAGYKTNTFPWWGYPNSFNQNILPVNKTSITATQVFSPFYNGRNFIWTRAIQDAQDYKPQDGWELIKQDLGYFYNNGVWNGIPFGTNSYAPTSNAYILLYNKYQAKLRVLFLWPFAHSQAQYLQVSLSFQPSPNYSSALFNDYNSVKIGTNVKPIHYPLDHRSLSSISATTIIPDLGEWAYVDFSMSYDPCTCFFNSDLQVDFGTIETANFTAWGHSLGTAVSIDDINNYSPAIGTNGVKGSQFSDSYLTSYISDPNGDVSNLVQDYKKC